MTRLKKLFWLTVWSVVAVLVGIQLTFAAKFLNLLFRQGRGPALSYLRGDQVGVQSSQGRITLILVHQVHPYLMFTTAAICLLGATVGLLWLVRGVSGPRTPQK
jgi:hypothetical protein